MTTSGLPTAAKRHLPRLALYAPLRHSSMGTLFSSSTTRSKEESLLEFCRSLQHEHLTAEDGASLLSGVEASLEDLGVDGTQQRESAQLIRAHGLDLLVHMNIDAHGSINSSSNNHGLARAAVQSFGSQLDQISNLGTVVSHINCRGFGMAPAPSSGNVTSRNFGSSSSSSSDSHSWNPETTLDYLLEVLPLSAEFLEDHPHIGRDGNETDVMGGAPDHLTGISHETTQGSMLYRLQPTQDLLEVVPPLRLTMELTTWQQQQHKSAKDKDAVRVNLPDEGEILSEDIVPHIDWIRTKASLLRLVNHHHNSNAFQDSQHLGRHQALWDCVWTRKAKRGVTNVFMTLDDDDNGKATGNSTMFRGEDEKECSPRVQRLAQSAKCIHNYYHHWSRRRAWETPS